MRAGFQAGCRPVSGPACRPPGGNPIAGGDLLSVSTFQPGGAPGGVPPGYIFNQEELFSQRHPTEMPSCKDSETALYRQYSFIGISRNSAGTWQEARSAENHLWYHRRPHSGEVPYSIAKAWRMERLTDTSHAIKGHMRHQTARSKENGKGKGKPWYKHGTDKNLFLKKNLQRKKNSLPLQPNAEIAQLVEHDLAKVGVASSSLVFRSKSSS